MLRNGAWPWLDLRNDRYMTHFERARHVARDMLTARSTIHVVVSAVSECLPNQTVSVATGSRSSHAVSSSPSYISRLSTVATSSSSTSYSRHRGRIHTIYSHYTPVNNRFAPMNTLRNGAHRLADGLRNAKKRCPGPEILFS